MVSQTSTSKARHRSDCSLDLVLAVCGRGEEGLELRRREIDVLVDYVPEEGAVAFGVAPLRVLEVPHGPVRHEKREQRADALDAAARSEERRVGKEGQT